MALLRVDARALVPRLRAELAALLTGLTGGDWGRPTACPGWSVHDVAAHLLGVELGRERRLGAPARPTVPGTHHGGGRAQALRHGTRALRR